MGDTLWGTPAIRAVKKAFPETGIDLLIQPQWKSLFDNNKNIRRLIAYNPPWYSQIKCLPKLITTLYDHVLIFHANKDIRRILPFLRSKSILSQQHPEYDKDGNITSSLTRIPLNKIVSFQKPVHAILRRLALLKEIKVPSDGTHMDIFINAGDKEDANLFLSKYDIKPKEFIYLNVGGSVSYKQWPTSMFISLSKIILKNTSLFILLGGGPEDQSRVDEIYEQLDQKRVIRASNHSIKKTCTLISQAHVLVSPDSGLMHIGFALKVPTVAMFWSINTNQENRNELNGPSYCGPLDIKSNLYSIISGSFINIKQNQDSGNSYSNIITVENVWDKVKQYL